jgi:hypothetical protein
MRLSRVQRRCPAQADENVALVLLESIHVSSAERVMKLRAAQSAVSVPDAI